MDKESSGRGVRIFFVAHVVCCGGLLLVATGALSGFGAWLLEGGVTWLLPAAVLGIIGGLLLRRWARRAGKGGEPRQSPARTPVRAAGTIPSAGIVRTRGERPEAYR